MTKKKQGGRCQRTPDPTPEEVARMAKEIKEENLEAKKKPRNVEDGTTPWIPKVYKSPNM